MPYSTKGLLTRKVQGAKRITYITYPSRKGGPFSCIVQEALIPASLSVIPDEGIEVFVQTDNNGRPARITLEDVSDDATSNVFIPPTVRVGTPTPVFHNPYNFIPAHPRNQNHEDLRDCPPVSQDRYHSERWSGTINVRLTTATPLLIQDAARAVNYDLDKKQVNYGLDKKHLIFPVRLGQDGLPYIAPTSIKGMLRSAFEAVTNSRLGIFHKHEDKLAYRMTANEMNQLIPARLEMNNGELKFRLMRTNLRGHAARLRRYDVRSVLPCDKGEAANATQYPDGTLPRHGDSVFVIVNNGYVDQIQKNTNEAIINDGKEWRQGWVCITGPNVDKKKFERVFLQSNNDEFITVKPEHYKLWSNLIGNYQQIHQRDLEKRAEEGRQPSDYLGKEPGKTGWSNHIHTPDFKELKPETLCYLSLSSDEAIKAIKAILPVTISRILFDASPSDLLSPTLKPPTNRTELSPAERVFGWVNQNGAGSSRGNIRIGRVSCLSDEAKALQKFPMPGLSLSILSSPKPQQSRFYVSKSHQGECLDNGLKKNEVGFQRGRSLRHRKVYPHHRNLPEAYWKEPMVERERLPNEYHYREYRRPDGKKDDQNRSISSWVNEGTEFEFDLHITNLSDFELGAILWLLTLPVNHFHRLGGGKPLGFGSVTMSIVWEKSSILRGRDLSLFYSRLDSVRPQSEEATSCINHFTSTIGKIYGKGSFESVLFIRAFLCCVRGFNKPVHYPRAGRKGQEFTGTIQPHQEGKSFEWFVANERVVTNKRVVANEREPDGPRLSLPNLYEDDGLPILPNNN